LGAEDTLTYTSAWLAVDGRGAVRAGVYGADSGSFPERWKFAHTYKLGGALERCLRKSWRTGSRAL
jgi:hypothetical protein